MKLLVLAQTPPPMHGQSLMVRTLVEGLPAHGIELEHVNLRLSRSHADIGGWRPGKVLAVLDACFHAIAARFAHGCDTLYYVPAPGKRGALYRDWLVMLLCRPFFKRLVLHWHAAGLGAWLATQATAPERWLTQLLLGRADLAIVLTNSLRADAEGLAAKQIAVVANGIVDPCPNLAGRTERTANAVFEVLFLGLCSKEKGLFDAAKAVLTINRQTRRTAFRLTAAGGFPDAASEARFRALCATQPTALQHAGFVVGGAKEKLLRESDCLCLPTRYPHEGQPLVLLEALAHDLPVIATNWRGIGETLPAESSHLVPSGDTHTLIGALIDLRAKPASDGSARKFYLTHFTAAQHLQQLYGALRSA